jgi:hypothetical protein
VVTRLNDLKANRNKYKNDSGDGLKGEPWNSGLPTDSQVSFQCLK